jgi:hypothetical protein
MQRQKDALNMSAKMNAIRQSTQNTLALVQHKYDADARAWQSAHPDFRTTIPESQWVLTHRQRHDEFPNACMCSVHEQKESNHVKTNKKESKK